MHNVALTWQQAAVLSAALLLITIGLALAASPRLRAVAPFARESFVIAALYSLWQLAGTLSVLGTSGAFQRARDLVRVEHDLHLPSEAAVQRSIAAHPLFVQACNVYYATMHFGVLFAFLIWLFAWHRADYPRIRNLIALVTLVCLLIQLIPVAPPRLLPGYVDTAAQYHQSVYTLGIAADQLSAMPSVHVAWAVLIGWAVVRVSSSPWRWLVLAHPIATVYVVAATANHFWLDGAVGVAILAACYQLQRLVRAVRERVRGGSGTRRSETVRLRSEPVARILR